MQTTIGQWWNTNKTDIGQCLIVVLGALITFAGKELMNRQRVPFLSAPPHPTGLSVED